MNLTAGSQRFLKRNLTLDDALPTRMPVYVNSVWYLFGATALMSFLLLIITGVVMCAFGPTWYHSSSVGHFVNSMHFWSTWVWGSLTTAVMIFTGLTGYLLQSSWDSQWIAVQAKDTMNAMGIGGFFNTLNTGQMLTVHVALLPVIAIIFLRIHLFLVRRDSPVKPLPAARAREGGMR